MISFKTFDKIFDYVYTVDDVDGLESIQSMSETEMIDSIKDYICNQLENENVVISDKEVNEMMSELDNCDQKQLKAMIVSSLKLMKGGE